MAVSRRTVLFGLGAGVAASVAGCTDALRPDLGPSSSVPPSEVLLDVDAAPAGWDGLRRSLSGRLILPGESGYTTAKRAYNPAFDARKPAAIARVARAADVQKCVDHARAAEVPIAARSGGHSYPGNCVPNGGLVVDLSGLRGVSLRDDGTAVIGAGTRLAEVYAKLAAKGRCLPGGSCPTVGIGGLTLGGGVGVLTRKYGLTCDRLVSAKVVTADGRLLTASPDSHPDLYWALRGGGGGNFGVVTSFTFRTAAAPRLTVFSVRFPAGSAAAVLGAWQTWIADAPRELWSNLVISAGSPPSCRVGGCFVGSPGSLSGMLDRLVRATGVRPTARFADEKDYLDAMRYFAGCSTLSTAQCRPQSEGGVLPRERVSASSRVLVKPLRNPSALVSTVSGRTGMDLLLDSLGGAVAAKKADATAFPHRSALATVQIYAGSTASNSQSRASAVRAVRDELGRVLGPRGYVNYLDRSMPSWGRAYYGGNLARLQSVGRRYDPDKVFDFAQNVANA